jgi:hypothetical protein
MIFFNKDISMKSIFSSEKKFIPFTFFLFLFVSCGETTLNSIWREKEIIIDGSRADWEGSLHYFEDEKAAIGIMNDDNYIYFCLTTADRSKIMKILRNGFTIWLDPQNSDGETLGIQYPIKKEMSSGNNEMMQSERKFEPGDRNSNRDEEKISEMMIERFKTEQNEILIVNEDNYPLNAVKLHNEDGLEASINFESNQLVYELRVPIGNNKKSYIYTDVLPNEDLKVKFESGEMKKPQFDGEQGEGRKGGGMRPPEGADEDGMSNSGNRRGGAMGDRLNRGNMKDMMTPIDFSIIVKLAEEKNLPK